jgi:hypothetical protein
MRDALDRRIALKGRERVGTGVRRPETGADFMDALTVLAAQIGLGAEIRMQRIEAAPRLKNSIKVSCAFVMVFIITPCVESHIEHWNYFPGGKGPMPG